MNKFIIAAVIAFTAFIGTAAAQDVSVGVNFQRVNPDVRQPNFRYDKQTDSVGAVASITAYQTKNIGLTAEASANFGENSTQSYTALGGVTLKSRKSAKFQPYVKGLAGLDINHVGKVGTFRSDTAVGPAFKLAAGVDVGTGKVRFRAIEAGYLATYLYGQRQDNLVLSTGIVF